MAVRIERDSEPIPGYKLIERLGGGGFGEVWKCEAPGGLQKAIKFVFGNLEFAGEAGHRAEQELKALSRVKTVRHPYILSLERFDIIDGQLLIIMELADRNLWDRYKECRSQGLLGIPRIELLSYMREAAEALDLMNSLYQLQHLDIKPQNLFLVHQHVKVADFGLVKDMEGSVASVTGGITPVYAAPETFDGRVTRFSDQYSLGIVFQELLTGQRPFSGLNVRQLILQHLQAEPNLSSLEEHDRPIIGRSLNKTPDERYPTCRELVEALTQALVVRSPGTPSAASVPSPQSGGDVSTPLDSNTWSPQELRRHEPPLTPGPPPPVNRSRDSNQSPTHFIGVPGAGGGIGPRSDTPLVPATPPPPPRSGPRAARPGEAAPPQTRDVDHGGALSPALIVGVGGMGAQVLQSFRTLLAEEFDSADALPNVRLLLIDTDPDVLKVGGLPPDAVEKLREALGPPVHPLTSADLLLTPLNRPSHYLRTPAGRIDALSWINQRMLYRIPREQTTTGIRALGRLALFDHVRTIQRRLQMEWETCRDAAALDRAAKTTGRGVRSYRPRIFLVAGLMGGTGGGMFLDLAYLLRNLSRQMGTPNPRITGVLFVPQMEKRGSQHPKGREAAKGSSHDGQPPSTQGIEAAARVGPLGNACAALTELLHYARPATEFQARYFEREAGLIDGDPPFNPMYLLPLPESPRKKESQEVIGMTAHFLFGECASAFGRWRGLGAEADVPGDPVYRTLGLCRVSFPRRKVVEEVAARCLRKIIERWMSKDSRPLVEQVREWVAEQWRGHDLGAEHFIARIQDACEKHLGKNADKVFGAALEPLVKHFGDIAAEKGFLSRVRVGTPVPLEPEEILEVLVRYEQFLGRPQVTQEGNVYTASDWNVTTSSAVEVMGTTPGGSALTVRLAGQREAPPGSLVLFLREAATTIANEWSQTLAELPVKLIEKPAFRLAGAEESIRQVVASIELVLELHEPLGRELADKSADAYGRVLAFINSLDDTRSWPRRGMTPELVVELLRTYAKARYQSLVLQQVLAVYVSLRGCLTDELREINFCRARIQELLVHLSGDKSEDKPDPSLQLPPMTEGRVRYLFPQGWSNLKEAIDQVEKGLTPEDLLQLDAQLQQMIRSNPAFNSLVNVCVSSKNMTKELAQALKKDAVAFVEEKLGATDAARLFLAQSDDPEAVGEQLLTCFEEAVPEQAATATGASRPSWERVVVGVPEGEASENLRSLVLRKLGETDLVLAVSEEDLVLYREWSGLRLADVDPLGPAAQEAYQCLLGAENFTPHSRADVSFQPPH